MPPKLRLDEGLTQIVDAAAQRLTEAKAPGELLEKITEVVSGERARRRPEPPYLWTTLGAWTEEHPNAIHTKVTAQLLTSAFVKSESPEEGWLESVVLAARGRSVLLADRKLGLAFVQDVVPVRGEAIGQIRDGRRFGAFARVDVVFTIQET